MTKNEIARKLQQALNEYTAYSVRSTEANIELSSHAGHVLAVAIGYLITDIDADVEADRVPVVSAEAGNAALDRAYQSAMSRDWVPVPPSPRNSLDGE